MTVAVECERVDVDFTKAQVRTYVCIYVTYTLWTVCVLISFHIIFYNFANSHSSVNINNCENVLFM